MFSSRLGKQLCTLVASTTVAGGSFIGYKYWTNGQLGNEKMFHTPNQALIPVHQDYIQQLSSRFSNNALANDTTFTTITPQGEEYNFQPPKSRKTQLQELGSKEYDLLVIGGGISGTATAHEATTRGFNVALVDKGDFGSCTSSRSTKLIHGGVRYLEQAFWTADLSLIELVSEALHERSHMINAAEYMNEPLPILIPLSKWWEIPYMGAGVLLYDLFACREEFPRGKLISAAEAKKRFPSLDVEKLDLKAALVYYDGQMNDSRYTLSLALTAEQNGANVANYLEVVDLHHDASGALTSATVRDTLDPTSTPFTIKCKSIVNAAGPYADKVRKMDDPSVEPLIVPSSGSHITLPEGLAPQDYGLLIPKTPDGRLLFLLPWEDCTVAGTTDAPHEICDVPTPLRTDIKYIVDIVNQYITKPIREDDVQSAWSGLRPLVKDPTKGGSTSKLSRNHLVLPTPSHLVSLMGGKFTTNRQMAQDTVDAVIQNNPAFSERSNSINDAENVYKRTSSTFNTPIYGAADAKAVLPEVKHTFNTLRPVLEESYKMSKTTADYLARNYGTRSLAIASNAYQQCLSINPNSISNGDMDKQCVLNAEIDYTIDYEMAYHVDDILFRRNRMGFVNTKDVLKSTPYVIDYMGKRFNWNDEQKKVENERVEYLLDRMDVNKIKLGQPLPGETKL